MYYLTKQKHIGETNMECFSRLLNAGRWRPIAAKLEDRYDNILTIASMPYSNQVTKLEETAMWLPVLTERLDHFLKREVLSGTLDPNFLSLPDRLGREIEAELRVQIRRVKALKKT